jgi:hypothetical protein
MPARSPLIDKMIAETPDWRGETLAELRETIHSADPEIAEDVKWIRPANPLGSATFEHNGIVCVGVILKERVRISFFDGARLPDPHGLFNAQLEGKSRAIDFRQGDDPRERELVELVQAGVALNEAKAASKKR